jgi:molybdopterin converting factor subunit 1
MLVRARFFAAHREKIGVDRLEFDLPSDSTVARLVERVVDQFPALAPAMKSARFAVNREYLPASTILHPGDEVAFIPPVAGGGSNRW